MLYASLSTRLFLRVALYASLFVRGTGEARAGAPARARVGVQVQLRAGPRAKPRAGPRAERMSTRTVGDENSCLLQEALEPY
jgi:hypothetical protein